MKITERNLLKELKKKNPQAIEYIIEQYGGAIKAVYKAIDRLRKELKRTSKEISLYEEESAKEIKQLYREERGFFAVAEDASDKELEKLLKCLSEEDRDLFYRRYVYEQPITQISLETGMHRDRIYSRISRGKKKIQKFFREQGGKGNETKI